MNQARNDGLQLAHWLQKQAPLVSGVPNTNTQDGQQSSDLASEPIPATAEIEEGEYKFAKYNLQIQAPTYTPDLYDQHLQNEEWSKEETEYLLDLHKDFYGKWPLITDRYDFKPTTAHDVQLGTDPATQAAPTHRTMEELKHRFYTVSAALMSAQTPLANMTTAEFELHEKLQKFNPKQETDRKRHKELIMARSEEDKKEEDHLLAELRRIYFRQKRNEEERAELRDRLDHSMTDAVPDAPPFKTSAEINALFQKMSSRDKIQKQRRSILDAGSMQSPANAGGTPNAGGASKRGSIAVGGGPNTPGAGRRQLSAQDDIRYGVSHHDRLTSGVTFRSDRILKVRQAKSQVQTQKIAAILTELQVPDLFQMPTDAVVGGMEKLVQKVGLLIEARKVKEKEENDLKVAIERKKLRDAAGGGSPAAVASEGDHGNGVDATMVDVDGEQEATELNDVTEVNEEENEEDEEGEEEEDGENAEEDGDGEEIEEDDEDEQSRLEGQDNDNTNLDVDIDDQEGEDDGEEEEGEEEDEELEEETFVDAEDGDNIDHTSGNDAMSERQDSEEAAEEAADRSQGEDEEDQEVEEEEPDGEQNIVEESRNARRKGKRSASVLSAGSSTAIAKRMRAG